MTVLKQAGRAPVTVELPPLTSLEEIGYREMLKPISVAASLRELVELHGARVRVAVTDQGEGILWQQLAVPEELRNVLVLDASYPIRLLCQLDPTLTPGSRMHDVEVKRFDNVTIHQMFANGGRHSVQRSFQEDKREKRRISREVVEVVKSIPKEEGILLFTFKARGNTDIRRILLSDLQAAGIDIEEKRANGKPRVSVLTWGDETSLNDHSHCENVILAGVLHRSHLDVASVLIGQLNNPAADIEARTLHDLVESEAAHCIFQAASRGHCREIDHGQAKPMKAWVVYRGIAIQSRVNIVMPGVKWAVWAPVFGAPGDQKAAPLALRIVEHLKGIDPGTEKVSTRELKAALGVGKDQEDSFTKAAKMVHDLFGKWRHEGRSFVNTDRDRAAFWGFRPES